MAACITDVNFFVVELWPEYREIEAVLRRFRGGLFYFLPLPCSSLRRVGRFALYFLRPPRRDNLALNKDNGLWSIAFEASFLTSLTCWASLIFSRVSLMSNMHDVSAYRT